MPRWGGSRPSDSESSSESAGDSDAGQRPLAGLGIRLARPIVRAPARVAVSTRVECPGCRRVFASLNILKKHRNSHRLANAACPAAARAHKRPQSVPRATGEADGDGPVDAGDLIARMMGDRDQSVAAGDAQDPSRYPAHCDGVSGLNFRVEKVQVPCEHKRIVH
jgi:hypothetical protein